MAPYLFWEFIILIVGVWLMVALFIVYGWALLKRQQHMIHAILEKLNLADTPTPTPQPAEPAETQPESNEEKPKRHIYISRNEPISKYKDLEKDESVIVSFVDDK
ncbi:MAG: hypothetical protein II942_00670 [Alphaproteobacteria bacterium]|nr:hypothetical protein [Alphaproteobacteria bacterium]